MSAESWLSLHSEMPDELDRLDVTGETDATGAGAPPAAGGALLPETPSSLEDGEHVELWLTLPEAEAGAPSALEDLDISQLDIDGWDVRPAEIASIAGPFVAIAAGGWGLSGASGTPSAPGARAIVRRIDSAGIAEWEGIIATSAETVKGRTSDTTGASTLLAAPVVRAAPARAGGAEAVLVLRLEATTGRLYQRRRSPRLAVRLRPVRLVPLPDEAPMGALAALAEENDLAPVARLSDVSAHGAAIVIDTPLETGTTVAMEFELPGELAPFTIRGRVVEPAISLHGDVLPQPDGLPGFRRGIEFLGNTAGRESRRLAGVVTRLLQRDTSRQ